MQRNIFLLLLLLPAANVFSQQDSSSKKTAMKLNAGIVTSKLKETKEFYQHALNFGVSFENEFYLLLHTPNKQAEISFLLPHHPSQQPLFQPAFAGKGMFLTIEVDNVDAFYKEITAKKSPLKLSCATNPGTTGILRSKTRMESGLIL